MLWTIGLIGMGIGLLLVIVGSIFWLLSDPEKPKQYRILNNVKCVLLNLGISIAIISMVLALSVGSVLMLTAP